MGSRRAPRHGGGLRLEALSGGEVQGAARHQALGDGMIGSWAYKLLEAAVIVDLRSTTKVLLQSCQKVPSRPKCSTDYRGPERELSNR